MLGGRGRAGGQSDVAMPPVRISLRNKEFYAALQVKWWT